jgi:hypothetical protein
MSDMSERKVPWWEIEDLEERQRAHEERYITPWSVRDDPKEYARAARAADELRAYKAAKRRRIIAEGKICSKCGGEIGDTVYRYQPLLERGLHGTRYRTRPTTDANPICEACAPNWLPERLPISYTLYEYPHNVRCETCGRAVIFVSATKEPRGRVFCSEDCKSERKARKSKGKRLEPHNISCEVCGTEFVAKRSDAKTCSNACRQRQHRQRTRA